MSKITPNLQPESLPGGNEFPRPVPATILRSRYESLPIPKSSVHPVVTVCAVAVLAVASFVLAVIEVRWS